MPNRGEMAAAVAKGGSAKFEFQEGLLVRALRTGAWVVLDEINLAPGDILQRIQGLTRHVTLTVLRAVNVAWRSSLYINNLSWRRAHH